MFAGRQTNVTMTKKERTGTSLAEAEIDDEDEELGKNRKRRTGVVAGPLPSGRCGSSVPVVSECGDCRLIEFPSVEKLVHKYSSLITSQQQEEEGDEEQQRSEPRNSTRECLFRDNQSAINLKCETWKTRYFSPSIRGENYDETDHSAHTASTLATIVAENTVTNVIDSPTTSDDGLWFLDVPGRREAKRSGSSDSAIETLVESDDDKCPSLRYDDETISPQMKYDQAQHNHHRHLCRRQTWTGPLLNETENAVANGDPVEKVCVRKTCSLDQSMKNCAGFRSLYRARRKGSTFSNDEFDDDEVRFRSARTPSVVISDHSDDPNLASSTITLEDIEEFQNCRLNDQLTFCDSSSDCSVTSVWSNLNNCTTVLDNEYEIVECGRKISDCSTCSTFSCDEYELTSNKVRIHFNCLGS